MNPIRFPALMFALLTTTLFPALAGVEQSTMQVNTQVNTSCAFSSITGLNFGNYEPTKDNNTKSATNTVSLRCVAMSPNVRVSFDQGLNPAPESTCATPVRRLRGTNGQYLKYELDFNLSGNLISVGCEPGINERVIPQSSFVHAGTVVTLTQYGRLPGGQDVSAGTYTDTVGVSIYF